VSGHVTELLSAYLDGEMTASDRLRLDEHLLTCEECSRRLEQLSALERIAARLPELQAPDGYFDGFPARVRGRLAAAKPRARMPAAWSWAAALAATLAVAVLAPRTLRNSPPPAAVDDVRAVAPPPAAPATSAPAPLATAAPVDAPQQLAAPRRQALEAEKRAPEEAAGRRGEHTPRPDPPAAAAAPVSADRLEAARREDKARVVAEATASEAAATERYQRKGEAAEAQGLTAPRDAAPAAPQPAAGAASAEAPRALRSARFEQDAEVYYRRLRERVPKDAAEARALREEWRRQAERGLAAGRADDARVQVVVSGIAAFRLSGDEADRRRAREDARAYLARSDALQKERVRGLLASLE
jgi:hypothetical protein